MYFVVAMMNEHHWLIQFIILFNIIISQINCYKLMVEDKTKCPNVKALRNFDIEQLLGKWYVIQYYSSSEEDLAYQCMQGELLLSSERGPSITMNFTYSFTDDPIKDLETGNITWIIPDVSQPAHWVHAEDTYEGVYNTYILDSDYTQWSLLLHCAEKSGSTRYLSSFIMSREPYLGPNVINYLREKLPKYDIDLTYIFEMSHQNCTSQIDSNLNVYEVVQQFTVQPFKKHPLKRVHFKIN